MTDDYSQHQPSSTQKKLQKKRTVATKKNELSDTKPIPQASAVENSPGVSIKKLNMHHLSDAASLVIQSSKESSKNINTKETKTNSLKHFSDAVALAVKVDKVTKNAKCTSSKLKRVKVQDRTMTPTKRHRDNKEIHNDITLPPPEFPIKRFYMSYDHLVPVATLIVNIPHERPLLVIATKGNDLIVWDLYNREEISRFESHKEFPGDNITSLAAFVPSVSSPIKLPFIISGTAQGHAHINVITMKMDEYGNIIRLPFNGQVSYQLRSEGDGPSNWVESRQTRNISSIHTFEVDGIVHVCMSSLSQQTSIWHLQATNLSDGENSLSFEFGFCFRGYHTDLILGVSAFHNAEDEVEMNGPMTVVTIGWDKWVYFWNWRSRHPYRKLKGHDKAVTCIIIDDLRMRDQDGDYTSRVMITGSLDSSIKLWDLQHWSIPHSDQHSDHIEEIDPRSKIFKLVGHTDKVTAMTLQDTGMNLMPPMLVSCSDDKSVIIWNLLERSAIRKLVQSESTLATVSAVSAIRGKLDIGLVIVATDPKIPKICLWNLTRTERIHKLSTSPVTGISICYPRKEEPNGSTKVVIATIDNTSTVFDYKSHSKLATLGTTAHVHDPHFVTHTERINGLVVYSPADPSKPSLAFTCSKDTALIAWDLDTYTVMKHRQKAHDSVIFCIALYDPNLCAAPIARTKRSTDETDLSLPIVFTGSLDRSIRMWTFHDDSDSLTLLHSITDAHKQQVRSIAVYHPKIAGEDPCLISGSYDLTTVIWNLRTRTKMHTLAGEHKGYIFDVRVYDPVEQYGSLANCPQENCRLLLVTGSYDNTAIVWDLEKIKSNECPTVIHTLKEHKESVTAMAIYSPKSTTQYPLVVTGSIDKLVIVWSLITGDRLQILVGHEDRICYLVVFNPPEADKDSFPTILSGSDDSTTIIWMDSLHQKPFQPLRESVNSSFELDLKEDDWPLISKLEEHHKENLFVENPHLFYLAIEHKRSDFITKFRGRLPKVLPLLMHSSGDSEGSSMSILTYAIASNDLVSVKIILDCWIELLQIDINDILQQRLYHPSYYFNTMDELRLLAGKYPNEFVYFMQSLPLVKNHASLINCDGESRLAILDRQRRFEITGTDNRDCDFSYTWQAQLQNQSLNPLVMWMRGIKVLENEQQPITSLMIPLRFETSKNISNSVLSLIRLCSEVCDQLNSPDIFESEVCTKCILWMWDKHSNSAHMRALVMYLLFIGCFTACMFSYQTGLLDNSSPSLLPVVAFIEGLNIAVLIALVFLVWVELRFELRNYYKVRCKNKLHSGVLSAYLGDVWNIIDVGLIFFGIVGMLLRLWESSDTVLGRCMLAAASILMWLKLLYFLRPFRTTGPLVMMLFQIGYEIRVFLVVLTILLIGFAQAFYLLCNVDPSSKFGTVVSAFYNSFLYMLGQNIEPYFETAAQPLVASLLLILFMSSMMILMLNVLIGLMGDAFAKIRDDSEDLYYKYLAAIILDQDSYLQGIDVTDISKKDHFPAYIHVLKYDSDQKSQKASEGK